MKRKLMIAGLVAGVAVILQPLAATAQPYPTKPVRWVVPFPAGGGADALARTVAQELSAKWGQQVLVDNKPGGYTVIGASEVIRAPADGHTLFQPIDSTLTMNQFLFSKPTYDPLRDFTHITRLANATFAVFGSDATGSTSVAEVVAKARRSANKVTFGSGTITAQMAGEMLAKDAKVLLTHVPYKGTADVLKGMLGGEIDIAVDVITPYVPYVSTGKLKALATTGQKRSAAMPNVPTLVELGYPNAVIAPWHGLSAPAGLPAAIQEKIRADVAEVLALPRVREKLLGFGFEAAPTTSKEFVDLMRSDASRMQPLIREMKLQIN